MGSDLGEFWWSALTFSRFGHQSRFDVPWGLLWVAPTTGHVASRSSFISPTTASGLSDMGNPSGFPGGVSSGIWCGGAVEAQAPVDDLGLVDREAVVVGGGQAGGGTDGAIDVGQETARPAHDVVVVVPDPRLVARHGARRLDAPHQARRSQRTQHVVHRLMGHLTEILTHDTDERVRVGMRMLVHRSQHRHPGTRHTQRSPAQQLLNIRSCGHDPKCGPFSGKWGLHLGTLERSLLRGYRQGSSGPSRPGWAGAAARGRWRWPGPSGLAQRAVGHR